MFCDQAVCKPLGDLYLAVEVAGALGERLTVGGIDAAPLARRPSEAPSMRGDGAR